MTAREMARDVTHSVKGWKNVHNIKELSANTRLETTKTHFPGEFRHLREKDSTENRSFSE